MRSLDAAAKIWKKIWFLEMLTTRHPSTYFIIYEMSLQLLKRQIFHDCAITKYDTKSKTQTNTSDLIITQTRIFATSDKLI